MNVSSLPDDIKMDMALSLVDKHGLAVRNVDSATGEITFRTCPLPWHDNGSPTAGFNAHKMCFNCFSCQSSGGLLWFIEALSGQAGGGFVEGISTLSDPRDWVREWIGEGTGENALANMTKIIKAMFASRDSPDAPIQTYSLDALKPWAFLHPYVTGPAPFRQIPVPNAVKLQLGFARMPVKVDGQAKESHRIVIPHFWPIRGEVKLVGWQSRRIANDGTPKYLLTEGHPRNRTLYNHNPAGGTAVVVESPFSVARHIHHLPMTATFGSMVTAQQIYHLADYSTVILWPDPDYAGWSGLQGYTDSRGRKVPGLAERLMPYARVLVVDSPWNVDPADLDDATATELVRAAVPYSAWRRPTELRCWSCKEIHSGKCAE